MTKKIIISKEYLYQKYIIENLSSYDIADELKCNVNTVCRYIKEFNLVKDSNKKFEARHMKTRKTCIEKYGVDWPSKSKEVQEKIENTTIERFGVKHASQSTKIKQKVKDTNLKRFSYEHALQNPELMKKRNETCIKRYGTIKPQDLDEFKEKSKQTNLNKYGVTSFTKTEEYREKTKITCQEKYGINNPSQSKEIKEKKKDTCLKNYGVENPTQNPEIREKQWATKKERGTANTSKPEDNMYALLQVKFPETKRNYQTDNYPFHCDFYIPELDLYIEYQGDPSHGKEPYDVSNPKHQKILETWLQKAQKIEESSGKQSRYRSFIDVWTRRDPLKRQTATANHLNWHEFFTFDAFCKWWYSQPFSQSSSSSSQENSENSDVSVLSAA